MTLFFNGSLVRLDFTARAGRSAIVPLLRYIYISVLVFLEASTILVKLNATAERLDTTMARLPFLQAYCWTIFLLDKLSRVK